MATEVVEEKTSTEAKAPTRKRKPKILIVCCVAVAMLIIVAVLIFALFYHRGSKEPITGRRGATSSGGSQLDRGPDRDDLDYIYRIHSEFGNEDFYIYILSDETILVENTYPEYTSSPDCGCPEPTGEYISQDEIIAFSETVKKRVLTTIEEIAIQSNSNEVDADEEKLTAYQKRVIFALVFNDETVLTIEDYLKYQTTNYGTLVQTTIQAPTQHTVVNNVAAYMNNLANQEFETLKRSGATNTKLKIATAYIGQYGLSFTYTKERPDKALEIKGYYFNSAGEIQEYNTWELSDDYHDAVINEFKKTSTYKDNQDKLARHWDAIIEDHMFETGKWYINDSKVVFLIPPSLIGLDDSLGTIVISVNNLDVY